MARAGKAIQQTVASQTQIIDDLLDLSRARTGKLTLALVAVDLKEVVSSIVAAAQGVARQKELTLDYQTPPGQVLALCDRVRTEQILWNLINNAVKFTPQGGTAAVHLSCNEGFAKFTVSDTGKGIPLDVLPTIFGMFTQESGSERTQNNTGLGVELALVQEFAVAQGGRVLAESRHH